MSTPLRQWRRKKFLRRILILIILVAMVGLGPSVPLPFNSHLWKSNIARRNMILNVNSGRLKGYTRQTVVETLGEPGELDKQGIDADIFGTPDYYYYFVPVVWKNCAFIVHFDSNDRVESTDFIDGQ